MKDKHMTRRIVQYAAGLIFMALSVVFMKRAEFGISPITAVPAAVSNITPLTLGNATIILHAICVVGQILLVRRITLKSVLTMLVGVPFGYVIDFFMWILGPVASLPLRIVLLLISFAVLGFGMQLIIGADLMLPAPDELGHTISQVSGKPMSRVKVCSDAVYIAAALAIDLIFSRRVLSVGIGTVLSMLLTGRFIGWTAKLFPQLTMEPFWAQPEKK